MSLDFVNRESFGDDATLEPHGATATTAAAAAALGCIPCLFVAGNPDGGVSVFAVGDGDVLTRVARVDADAVLTLAGRAGMTT